MSRQHFVSLVLQLHLFFAWVLLVNSKSQYVQPMNMGMQMAIPYDIANIFIRPIGGVTSVVLSIGLAAIVLFGIITSPFGYVFGIPSRKYVLGDIPGKENSRSRMLDGVPEFSEDAFRLIPEEFNSRSCQLLTICYAHGALRHLPSSVVKSLTFFTKNLINVEQEFHDAILLGVKDESLCNERYNACDKSAFSIIINTLIRFLPERARRKTKTKVQV